MFFKRTSKTSAAVIDAYHAAGPGLLGPEDALAHAAYMHFAQDAYRRHRVGDHRDLPRRVMRDLALVLVLVQDDRPSFDRMLVMAGISFDDILDLRRRAARRPELVEEVRHAMRTALVEARDARRAMRSAALAATAAAAATPLHDPLEEFLLAPEAARLAA
ncbi:hypothetical protein [Rhodoplanes roseus]|nr:hypothetical protein [Rhodoplanes roseus]